MLSIKEVSKLIEEGKDSAIVIGTFLDEFKSSSKEVRIKLISTLPSKKNLKKSAYLAAMVEKLCIEYKLKIPKWVLDKDFFLKEPIFYTTAENLKAVLIQESPTSFRRRNIFVSANALSRA